MKTKQIFLFLLTLIIFSSFSPSRAIRRNLNYTVTLSPSGSITGNTEYDLLVSYASGNESYKIIPQYGFTVLSQNPKDSNPSGNTVFHIRTNVGATNIRGTATAWVCSPSCSWQDGQIFLF